MNLSDVSLDRRQVGIERCFDGDIRWKRRCEKPGNFANDGFHGNRCECGFALPTEREDLLHDPGRTGGCPFNFH